DYLCNITNAYTKMYICFFFQAEDGIRDRNVTGVQTCALPILSVQMLLGNDLRPVFPSVSFPGSNKGVDHHQQVNVAKLSTRHLGRQTDWTPSPKHQSY